MSEGSQINTTLFIQNIFKQLDFNGDEKLSSQDIDKFRQKFPAVETGWIESLVQEKDISFHEFFSEFKFIYQYCSTRRKELKLKLDQVVLSLEKDFKKILFDKFDFKLEINCPQDIRLKFRYQNSTDLFKNTMKILKNNKTLYIIEVRSYKESFYIFTEKNEEVLFSLEEYLADLILGNKVEVALSKINKTTLSFTLSTKHQADEKFNQFKDKIKTNNDLLKKIKLSIRQHEDAFLKIKDYKSQKNDILMNAMAQLAKFANAAKEKNKEASGSKKDDSVKVSEPFIKGEISPTNAGGDHAFFMSKYAKQKSTIDLIGSTPHFPPTEDFLHGEDRRSLTGKSISNIKISEFQADEFEISRLDSLINVSNADSILRSVDDEFGKAKPTNPLAFKDEDKSVDMSINSGINNSQISENKLHSYAQKTKKVQMDKLKSFKSLNFANKNKNIETKYDDEFNNIDEKSKAAYNVCETFSSNIHSAKNSTNNLMGSNRISNPFNISKKINKMNIPTIHESMDSKPHTVRFKIENSHKAFNNKQTPLSKHEKKHSVDLPGNNINTDTINTSNLTKSKTVILDTSYSEQSDLRTSQPDFMPSSALIDSKLKALVTDTKLKAEKVLKTGSLLSILNLGIRITPIFSISTVNISEMYITAKKRKEEKNE